jgi:hypothetical protein
VITSPKLPSSFCSASLPSTATSTVASPYRGADARLVVGDQHAETGELRDRNVSQGRRAAHRRFHAFEHRQPHAKARALLRPRVDLDVSAEATHDALNRRQAKTGLIRTRRVERLEDVRQRRWIDSLAIVADLELPPGSVLAHDDAARHLDVRALRIRGVLDQVAEHLLDQVCVGVDRAGTGGRRHRESAIARDLAQRIVHVPKEAVRIDPRVDDAASTGVREHRLRELRHLARTTLDAAQRLERGRR